MRMFMTAAIFAALAAPAFAAPVTKGELKDTPRGDFMANLSEEQRECLAAKNCQQPTAGEKPNEDARECMKNAMTDCGIEMPARPKHHGDRPDGERKPHDGHPPKGAAPDGRTEAR